MTLPAISLRRVLLIARRDYLGYIKTWGFWISFFLPFVFGILGFIAAQAELSIQPVRYETVLDATGQHAEKIIQQHELRHYQRQGGEISNVAERLLTEEDHEEMRRLIEEEGLEAGRKYLDERVPGASSRTAIPGSKTVFIDPPADNLEALKPYLRGEKMARFDGEPVKLNGVLYFYDDDGLKVHYWSPNINNETVLGLTESYFTDRAVDAYLESGGLSRDGLEDAQSGVIDIERFDPTKEPVDGDSQIVTNADSIPYAVAAMMAGALWLTIFAGSYMLLTSMLEEKLNKLLEMMLASTRFSEIMFGKLLGAAALTLTAMAPYILLGVGTVIAFFLWGPTDIVEGLTEAFSARMIIFFFIYLILGYVFYGAFFIALGALAESAQDAQTLTTPIMVILTVCLMVVPIGMNSPDSPIIEFAAWFPLSAPFASIIKLASDPPLWEMILSAAFLFLCVLGVVWIASRVIRFGVLSGSGMKTTLRNIKAAISRKRDKASA